MKYWRHLSILLLMGCIGITVATLHNYYAPPHIRQPYQTTQHRDDTMRIAFIGDSWAAMHKEHDDNMAKMMRRCLTIPVKLQSYGICGLTSKEIYNHLFDDPRMREFMKQGYDYCIISAGINDSYKKMSTAYYQKSMDGIIRFLTANNICPVIVEIPDYDIMKTFDRQKTSRKWLRYVSMFFTANPIDCKQKYRLALTATAQNRAIIIHYQRWNKNYQKDLELLYCSDGMHLNSKGYNRLDSCIAKRIIHSIGQRKNIHLEPSLTLKKIEPKRGR